MQNTIYRCFFYVCLLFLPSAVNANIDAPKSAITPSTYPVFAKERRHFPVANPLDRFRIFKKTAITEGDKKTDKSKKEARVKRIFSIIALVIAGLALIYFLQGTIWLTVFGVGIFAYLRNRNRIKDWERERYERMQNPDVVYKTDALGRKKVPLSHPSNKWTRRAINRFVIGLTAPVVGAVFLILGFIGTDALILIGGGLIILGVLFLLVSIVNSAQAIKAKEPRSKSAKAILIIGLLFILRYLLFATAF